MDVQTGQMHCGQCGSYEYAFAQGETPEETLNNLIEAQDEAQEAHSVWHRLTDTVHIRTKINPRRVMGNTFYKVVLGASENGSQTLCGGQSTAPDMAWADVRFARNMKHVTCEGCKARYAQAHN